MRSLLVIVAITAVSTVDCREIPKEPEDQDSAGNAQIYNDQLLDDLSLADDPQLLHETVSAANALTKAEIHGSVLMDELAHTKRDMRKSQCKARNSCVVMGGFCVTNATLCSGRLVPEGCKRPGCQCCVPGTLELKIQSLEMELQSMKHNLTDTNEELKMEIQSLKSNNTDANADLKLELQSIERNMTNSNANIDLKLDSVKDAITNQDSEINVLKASNSNQETKLNSMNSALSNQNTDINTLKASNSNQETKLNSISSAISNQASVLNTIKKLQECPDGFLVSSYCFRMFKDTTRSWTSAQSKCQSEGLRLAEPVDSIAVALRKYVIDHYGTAQAWLGAKGDGSKFVWQERGSYLYRTSSLWDGTPSTSAMASTYCLELDAAVGEYNQDPGSPYDWNTCTSSSQMYTLCEKVN